MKTGMRRGMSALLCLSIVLGANSSTLDAKETDSKKKSNAIRVEAQGYSGNLERQIEQEPPLQFNATPEAIRRIEKIQAEQVEAEKKAAREAAAERSARSGPVSRKLTGGRSDNDKPVINRSSQFIFKDTSKQQSKNGQQEEKNTLVEKQQVQRVERMRQQLFKSNK